MVLDLPKLKRAYFHQNFPLTANPATRHQAFCCKNLIPIQLGNQFGRRQGGSIFVEKVCVTARVSSDIFYRKQFRTLRPLQNPTQTDTSLNAANTTLAVTNMDADFTGFKAFSAGVEVPVEGETINQINTTVLDRCTLTQADISTEIRAANPSQHILRSITVPLNVDPFTIPTQFNQIETMYRMMVFTSVETPTLTATTPAQFIDFGDTYTPIDPTFTPYGAYPFSAYFKDDIHSEIREFQEQYSLMGPTAQNGHSFEFEFDRHQIYYGSNPASVTPQRGGLFFFFLSDVNVGMSGSLSPDVFQEPERIVTRWLLTVCTEVHYYE